ncbi:MAG TPA: inositol monophosphatase family protein, partial [Polyangia bacterium]|nr:inositol monophosphatase family protein [Polyangia bacterium]
MRAVPGASDDLDLALELAGVADAITMARFRAEDLLVETKPDLTPVSEADRAVEQAMREHLASRRPDDTVFGEEYGGASGDGAGGAGGRRWIVDPIDGTKGYVRGMQVWGTL